MGLARVMSRARVGVRAPQVVVEVHVGGGLPSLSIVGLPEAAVREAKDRVRAAIACAQLAFPAGFLGPHGVWDTFGFVLHRHLPVTALHS